MANPNIVNVTTINGRTSITQLSTSAGSMLPAVVPTDKIYKINSLTCANISAADADVSVTISDGSFTRHILKNTVVPTTASLVAISKESGIYLQEGYDIQVVASANSAIECVLSWDEIS